MLKLFIGIAIIAFPKSVTWVGFAAAIIGLLFVASISLASSYFLIKARNRFKHLNIVDLGDLGYVCYGTKMRFFCKGVIMLANSAFLMGQAKYLGGQADLIVCDLLKRPDACGTKEKQYSFGMLVLMIPILLVRDFKQLSYYSGTFFTFSLLTFAIVIAFEIN